MANYTITQACGCQTSMQLFGPSEKREWRIKKMEGEDCDDCNSKKLAAERKVESEKNAAISAEKGLPTLEGSEKQCQWAETIRAKALAELEAIDQLPPADYLSPAARQELLDGVALMADEIKLNASAKDWIDNRDTSYTAKWLYPLIVYRGLIPTVLVESEAHQARCQAAHVVAIADAQAALDHWVPTPETVKKDFYGNFAGVDISPYKIKFAHGEVTVEGGDLLRCAALKPRPKILATAQNVVAKIASDRKEAEAAKILASLEAVRIVRVEVTKKRSEHNLTATLDDGRCLTGWSRKGQAVVIELLHAKQPGDYIEQWSLNSDADVVARLAAEAQSLI